jgi:AcrR family transcriptional regulator
MKSTLDRRVVYTKNAIKDAFLQLLKEKPSDKISVQELTNRAQINRVTFYQHYNSINDLYVALQNEFLQMIIAMIQNIKVTSVDKFISIIIRGIFENRQFCEAFFGKFGNTNFLQQIIINGQDEAVKYWQTRNIKLTSTQSMLLYEFISGGCVSIIQN